VSRLTTFSRGGLVFDVRDDGPADGEPVVLLHGFPQDSRCWGKVAPLLHQRGYRTLAPDQRGYSPRARPRGRAAYRVKQLTADVAALIETLDAGPVNLVGHDWGAAVAWTLAGRRPELLRTLATLSVPHPAAFARAMTTTGQALKSWYLYAFQLPWLPERVLGSRAFEAMLRRTGASREAARRDAHLMCNPAVARGALAWYRALPLSGPLSGPRAGRGAGPAKIKVPTLHVWSDGDTAVGPWGARLNPKYVDAAYTFRALPGVSHWIPEEAPQQCADLLLAHFGSVDETS
jgi:pimeloyl-ACP methyl ester carboxylesterase